jgi:hypothetical protein
VHEGVKRRSLRETGGVAGEPRGVNDQGAAVPRESERQQADDWPFVRHHGERKDALLEEQRTQ